jgi:putative transposase
MAAPLSVDLRERVLAAVDAGEMVARVARRFGVTRPTIYSWLALRDETGSLRPRPRPEAVRKLEGYREQIEEALAEDSGLTLVDLKAKLELPVGASAVRKALDLWDLTFKKKPPRV